MVFFRKLTILFLILLIKKPFYLCNSHTSGNNEKNERRFIFNLGYNLLSEIGSIVKAPFYFIVPGTKWCGNGNIAEDQSDLGVFSATDKCCRKHDNCDNSIVAGGYFKTLHNEGLFTRSSCECDNQFYNCLKFISTPPSYQVGIKYFNILAPPCYIFDYQLKRCIKYGGIFKRRCLEYEFNQSSPKIFQWRDSRLFPIL
ncbi:phospholipase A2-like [Cotesia glomerata]|uniref:phospholipase A2-like n=1 Tax=Cotesia glomerata TaxID=32391 RepID=UPI001D0155B6|nr:phospholipase A2-like [Cotesia glomerata]